jgi:hypothetical protein
MLLLAHAARRVALYRISALDRRSDVIAADNAPGLYLAAADQGESPRQVFSTLRRLPMKCSGSNADCGSQCRGECFHKRATFRFIAVASRQYRGSRTPRGRYVCDAVTLPAPNASTARSYRHTPGPESSMGISAAAAGSARARLLGSFVAPAENVVLS